MKRAFALAEVLITPSVTGVVTLTPFKGVNSSALTSYNFFFWQTGWHGKMKTAPFGGIMQPK